MGRDADYGIQSDDVIGIESDMFDAKVGRRGVS